MITKLTIRNFKKLQEVSFELGSAVVLIGPNNAGKSSVLQAITLWELGLRKWTELKGTSKGGDKRAGVSINRRDLMAIPVPSARSLWHHNVVRESIRENGSQKTNNVNIEITVEGNNDGETWVSAFEFDFANPESFYCRPLRIDKEGKERHIPASKAIQNRIAYLQPMSGLASREDKLTPGSIDVRVGEGKTADVLRNICYQLLYPEKTDTSSIHPISIEERWNKLTIIIFEKFGIEIQRPEFIAETGTITMKYTENGFEYDLSSGGRGFQQTLLLLAYLYSYPNRLILLDEPDAHLEVIRQKEIYHLISKIAEELNSQLIIASHSEVVLNQAAETDTVVAFYDDKCQTLNNTSQIAQFKKLLTQIGWDKYYLAKSKKHILYLEGITDHRILKAFAEKLNHPLLKSLENANVVYLSNNLPNDAENNFFGLKNIIPELKGIALFDRLQKEIKQNPELIILEWKKREIENYFAFPQVLMEYAKSGVKDLFTLRTDEFMKQSIEENTTPAALKDMNHPFWANQKLSDDYLPPIFAAYSKKLNLPFTLEKGRYYELVKYLSLEEIDKEVIEKLDFIHKIIAEMHLISNYKK